MPAPLVNHHGKAAVLMIDNVDTDQIIPSREMKTVSRDGLAEGLFAGWRYTAPGGREPNPDFVLNKPEKTGVSILISGENFGCGSSREHAVWALAEYGIRVIIAKSFGEIFHGNCLRNGILPIVLKGSDIPADAWWEDVEDLTIDLAAQTVTRADKPDWHGIFDIGQYPKQLLMKGLDPIALTLQDKAVIEAFFAGDAERRPWLYSAA